MPSHPSAPPSKLDDIPELLRAAVDAELGPDALAIGSLRAALDAYEAKLRGVAEARIARKVALALGALPPDVPDASEAREHLVAAMRALGAQLDAIKGSSVSGHAMSVHEGSQHTNAAGAVEPRGAAAVHEVAAPEALLEAGGAETDEPQADGQPALAGQLLKPAPLSQEQVRAFFQARAAAPPPTPSPRPTSGRDREVDVLRSLIEQAGHGADISADEGAAELDALDKITSDTSRWTVLSTPAQHLWLSYLVSRTRHLKNWLHQNNPALKKRLHDVIVRYPAFAKEARPGHVNGMRPDHEPVRASWAADADALMAELRDLAFPEPATTTKGPVSKPQPKKAKPRDRREAEPIEWPLRDRVREMRVVVFGGEPREEARQNLERMLGIGALEWPESNKPRRLDALATSLAAGKYDVLLVLRQFVAHKESTKLIEAARERGTPFALVESGYGIVAVREAIEAALQGR